MVESGGFVFLGEYRHSIDNKGRIIIPSRLRNDLGNNFIITKGLDGCLFIYSQKEWDNIINKYKNLPDTKDKRSFMRIFLSGASICDYDRQGRINIPQALIKYASIDKECVIVGVFDRLEIWSIESWNIYVNDNSSNLSNIADNLFKFN